MPCQTAWDFVAKPCAVHLPGLCCHLYDDAVPVRQAPERTGQYGLSALQRVCKVRQLQLAPGHLAEMAEIAPADVQEPLGDPGRVARSGARHDHRYRAFA